VKRTDGRELDQLRPLAIEPGFIDSAHGSVLFSIGRTRLVCTAMVEESVPGWMRGRGTGWVTSEYGMLPGSTSDRKPRDATRGKLDGRTVEIQRLIGRSLRSVVDFKALGERTIWIDCDVLQADGGTRTAAITGAYVALADAVSWLRAKGALARPEPLVNSISAVSVGVIDGEPRLDLMYEEDVRAETDMNVVVTGKGEFVEVQGTAEGAPFRRDELDALLDLAVAGCTDLARIQTEVLSA
jgi:ribonuclease PH